MGVFIANEREGWELKVPEGYAIDYQKTAKLQPYHLIGVPHEGWMSQTLYCKLHPDARFVSDCVVVIEPKVQDAHISWGNTDYVQIRQDASVVCKCQTCTLPIKVPHVWSVDIKPLSVSSDLQSKIKSIIVSAYDRIQMPERYRPQELIMVSSEDHPDGFDYKWIDNIPHVKLYIESLSNTIQYSFKL